MSTFKRILCPTDFSEVSAKAERIAVALAKRDGARLSLLHVDPPLLLMAPYGEVPVDVGLFEEQRRQAERDMAAARQRAEAAGVTVDTDVRGGAPAREILDIAGAGGIDLIILGTHGRGGVEHLLLGSVAEKVLRKASCPVMVVPAQADVERGPLFKRILCPIDGSAPAAAAVSFAVSLARETDAAIRLLHVIEPLPIMGEIAPLAEDYQMDVEARVQSAIRSAVPPEVRQWCRIEEQISVGKASERILATAHAHAADVIVIGVRGRNALDLMAFGSTTNEVIRRAQCPVLVVHPPQAAASDPRHAVAATPI
jgi:nucleotide-binding universal stress UspA family protein